MLKANKTLKGGEGYTLTMDGVTGSFKELLYYIDDYTIIDESALLVIFPKSGKYSILYSSNHTNITMLRYNNNELKETLRHRVGKTLQARGNVLQTILRTLKIDMVTGETTPLSELLNGFEEMRG